MTAVVAPIAPAPTGRCDFLGSEALYRLLRLTGVHRVLDIGCGDGAQAEILRAAGRDVVTLSLRPPADHIADFLRWDDPSCDFDALWACHVLEHQVDPGAFLRECRRRLKPGGWLAVTVPPAKHDIVGGHVTLWNAGLLLYQMILAGFDCSAARVGSYGYNISVLVQYRGPITLPELAMDCGDIERLAPFFPVPVVHGFDGELDNIRWNAEAPTLAAVQTSAIEDNRAPASVAAVPETVAILGLGPSVRQYLELTKRNGGRRTLTDEVWGINALGDVFACDRIFHMDDVRIQQIRADAAPNSNIAHMLRWLKTHPGPIYTSCVHPDYPGTVAFPLEAVINDVPEAYFNNTAAYAIAYAIHIGVRQIYCFGMDFSYPDTHHAERGRACVEFWLGIAAARGIRLVVPKTTSLLDAMYPQAERFYGYDCVELNLRRDGDRIHVDTTPRTQLPTASEIEARYDHARPPAEQSALKKD